MIKVEFTGFINEIKQFGWGDVLKVAHAQRSKNDAGEWVTSGKDYFDVIAPQGSSFREGDKVDVIGKLKTKLYDRKDGGKGVSLEVRAESVVVNGEAPRAAVAPAQVPDSWTAADTELPF